MKDYPVKDTIDWSIASDEIEMLKSKVVPIYWELLLESTNTVVRVTERLYILQDWNRGVFDGNKPDYETNFPRHANIGLFTE